MDKFEENIDPIEAKNGHKRSLSYILNYLQKEGKDIDKIIKKIKDIILKTIICVLP